MLGVNFPFKIDAFVLDNSKIPLSSSSLKLTFLPRFSVVEVEQPALVVADDRFRFVYTSDRMTAQVRSKFTNIIIYIRECIGFMTSNKQHVIYQ